MANKKDRKIPLSLVSEAAKAAKELMDAEIADGRSIEIKDATIKDDFCNYNYEVSRGISIGFTHTVKGKGIIEDDIKNAFAKLNVHLAFIDDVYKHSDVQFQDIDKMHNDELAMLYNVTGFKIKGGEENESIILVGNKYLSAGSRMELESPKISIDSLSSYKWYNELKAAADECRKEVALYHYGKYTPVKEEEEKENKKQTKMTFVAGEKQESEETELVDLENGKL